MDSPKQKLSHKLPNLIRRQQLSEILSRIFQSKLTLTKL